MLRVKFVDIPWRPPREDLKIGILMLKKWVNFFPMYVYH